MDPNKFSAFNVLEDEELRQGQLLLFEPFYLHGLNAYFLGLKEFSDWPTLPQLYLGSEFVGGCDILMSMHQNGELSKLLEEKEVLVPSSETSGPSS